MAVPIEHSLGEALPPSLFSRAREETRDEDAVDNDRFAVSPVRGGETENRVGNKSAEVSARGPPVESGDHKLGASARAYSLARGYTR